jgi:hypothetical protein
MFDAVAPALQQKVQVLEPKKLRHKQKAMSPHIACFSNLFGKQK